MKVSEDRFPLLFVYLEDQEEQCNVRTRTVTRGAAEILSRWPQYLTFVSYMSVIGLLALLVCFILSVLVVSLTARDLHNPKKFSVVRCDNKQTFNQVFSLSNFEHLTDAENATFIVDLGESNVSAVACAVESYLIWTSLPVYHVRFVSSDSMGNATVFEELEKKFKNYKIITAKVESFLSGTSFANSRVLNESTFRFISKVLLSWNFGGTVIDSNVITLSNFRNLVNNPNNSLVMGLIESDNVFISASRVCHSFIFSLMKYVTKNEGQSQTDVTEAVYREYCDRGRDCTSVKIVSKPYFCESEGKDCIFSRFHKNTPHSQNVWNRVCPLAKFFS